MAPRRLPAGAKAKKLRVCTWLELASLRAPARPGAARLTFLQSELQDGDRSVLFLKHSALNAQRMSVAVKQNEVSFAQIALNYCRDAEQKLPGPRDYLTTIPTISICMCAISLEQKL